MDMNLGKLQEGQGSLACCSPLGHRVRNDLATKQQPSMRNMGKVTSYCANEEKDIVILI